MNCLRRFCPRILTVWVNSWLSGAGGVRWVHIDVMDGMFAPSISYGMPVIQSIRKNSRLFFDVHMMVEDPGRYVDRP